MPDDTKTATAVEDADLSEEVQETPAPAAAKVVPIGITNEQLNARLKEATEAGSKKILKELGFEKAADVKAVLKLVKEREEADLSDKQKLEKRIEELEPAVTKASLLEKLVSSMVDEQFASLPEAARNAIDEAAEGEPHERLRMMQVMRKSGLLGAPAVATTTAEDKAVRPKPADTSPPVKAPPAKAARTKWDEFQDLEKKNATLGAIFYEKNRVAIEAARPTSSQ